MNVTQALSKLTRSIRVVVALLVAMTALLALPGVAGAVATIDPRQTFYRSYTGDRATLFGDVNGDGKVDVLAVNNDGLFVSLATPTATARFTRPTRWTSNPYYGDRGTYLADVDGDKKADAIVVNNNGVVVRKSTGSSFSANELWTDGAYYGDRNTFFADVTGDKKADAVVVNDTGAVVRPANDQGTRFLGNENWRFGDFRYTYSQAADLDQDGRSDLVSQDLGWNATVFYSWKDAAGRGSFGDLELNPTVACPGLPSSCYTLTPANLSASTGLEMGYWNNQAFTYTAQTGASSGAFPVGYGHCGSWPSTFADWNKDGLAEFLQATPGKVVVFKNTGGSFQALDSCPPAPAAPASSGLS
jgi:hypothetical protein